jgi:hypothetical protein
VYGRRHINTDIGPAVYERRHISVDVRHSVGGRDISMSIYPLPTIEVDISTLI